MVYEPDDVRNYYSRLGVGEWERLAASAHARMVLHLHLHFLRPAVGTGRKVLDAGSGAGRFAAHIAQSGCRVTLLDLSEEQIRLAKANLHELGLLDQVDGFVVGDICDLSRFGSHSFDTVVCYGGAMNYLFDRTELGLEELVRVARPGGTVLASVMSRWGIFRFTMANEKLSHEDFFGRPDYWMIPQVLETGDLLAHPEVRHPARHFFESGELRALFRKAGLVDVELGCAPSLSSGLFHRLGQMEENPEVWRVICVLEEKAYTLDGLLDAGEFLLVRGRVPEMT